MDKNRWCRLKKAHRLYHAIGEECPCYKEMLARRKARVAQHRAQNQGNGMYGMVASGIQNVQLKVQRSSSYTPAKKNDE